MILPKIRDPRFITVRRGGTLHDDDHRRLAIWAAAVADAAGHDAGKGAGSLECRWQRAQLPIEIRELVLDDQRLRNELCWFVFDC